MQIQYLNLKVHSASEPQKKKRDFFKMGDMLRSAIKKGDRFFFHGSSSMLKGICDVTWPFANLHPETESMEPHHTHYGSGRISQ